MIGILLIATNKYRDFVPQFVKSVERYFMKEKNINIYLFTDILIPSIFHTSERINISQVLIPPYKFPYATLYRYRIFLKHLKVWSDCSHVFYFDVDMRIVAPIGDEMLADIVAVRHPGFDKVGGGSWERRKQSSCYTENCKTYYAGGVQGGERLTYLRAMQGMENMISWDEVNGVMPVWHDESAWNCYLSKIDNFKELDSSYCMVEQMDLRRKWKIDGLKPKVIALEKNHAEIRKTI